MAVGFGVLGDVTAVVDGQAVDVGHARQRAVLAVLLVEANRPVPADVLLDRVWTGDLPRHARTALAGYLSRLRKLLTGVPIRRGPGGYALLTEPETVDLVRFRRLAAEARASGDDGAAARLFAAALGLWRGEAFATLDTPWLNGVRAALERERHAAELDRNDLALRRGEHALLLGDLARAAERYPLDERLAGQEILALHRSGRSDEALHRYARLAATLAAELGTDPGPELRHLHRSIISGEGPSPSGVPRPVVPRQLPAAPRTFTGRADALGRLDAVARGQAAAAVISSVTGTAGVGKTTLAVHWSHRVADRFPDGQLYLNLRGYEPDGNAITPAEALRDLLGTLAVGPERMPAGTEAQAALYRSLLAGRRMLILLDNARDADQVRPLLPGAPGCLVVVTSRNQMPGLVAVNDAHPIELDLLTRTEAKALLTVRIGAPRIEAEPDAVERLIDRCARLPLALAIVAGRAVLSPGLSLAALAAELDEALDALASDDVAIDLRAVFRCSYRALDPAAARLFRLLGVHWGPDASLPAIAALAEVSEEEARATLGLLVEAGLIQEHLKGRWAMHDLLRAYSKELAQSDPHAQPAVTRVLDFYVRTAHEADLLVYPSREPVAPPPGRPGLRFPGRAAALEWFVAEHAVLVRWFATAAGPLLDAGTWHLGWALSNVLNLRGMWQDQALVQEGALRAARRMGDRLREAHALRALGRVRDVLSDDPAASDDLRAALRLFEELGELAGAAQTQVNLARHFERRGRIDDALEHDEESLRLFRKTGSLAGQARALNNIGWGLIERARFAEALDACRAALDLHRSLGHGHGAANAWLNIGIVHLSRNEPGTAVGCVAQALRLYRESHDRPQEANSLDVLGDAHAAAGDRRRARSVWEQAATLMEELGLPAVEVREKLAALRAPVAGCPQ